MNKIIIGIIGNVAKDTYTAINHPNCVIKTVMT